MSKTEELTKLFEQISRQKNDEEETKERKELLGNFLIEAIKKDDILMQKLVFLLGADATATFNQPIKIASENGHAEVVKILIDNGADVTADHNEAIKIASEYGYTKVVKLLIEAGASFS